MRRGTDKRRLVFYKGTSRYLDFFKWAGFCNLPKAWCVKCFDEATSVLEFNTLRLNTQTDLATVWLKKQNHCKGSTADRHLVTQKRKPPKYAIYRIEIFSVRLKLKIVRGPLRNRTWWLEFWSRKTPHWILGLYPVWVLLTRFATTPLRPARSLNIHSTASYASIVTPHFFWFAHCIRLRSPVVKNRLSPL